MNKGELTVKHLWDIASYLKSQTHTSTVIKSHILSKCIRESTFCKLKLPNKAFSADVRCSHCHVSWSENKYSTKISKRKKLTKHMKRKYKATESNKNGIKTEKEVTRAKEMLHGDILMVKCLVCNKTTKVILKTESIKDDSSIATPQSVKKEKFNTPIGSKNIQKTLLTKYQKVMKMKIENSFYNSPTLMAANKASPHIANPNAVDKKKRQRDRFAGLCKTACQTSTPVKSNNPLHLLLKPRGPT